MPLIREMIVEMFNKEPWADVEPGSHRVLCASIYGAFLRAPADPQTFELPELESPNTTIKIQNKVTHFLGIESKVENSVNLSTRVKNLTTNSLSSFEKAIRNSV